MIKCNLAVLMAERKLSIQDVADQTGLSRTTVSALVNENGKGIQFDTMNALCELLQVTPGDLFTFSHIRSKFEVLDEKESFNEFGPEMGYLLTLYGDVECGDETFKGEFEVELVIFLEAEEGKHGLFFLRRDKFEKFANSLAHHEKKYLTDTLVTQLMNIYKERNKHLIKHQDT